MAVFATVNATDAITTASKYGLPGLTLLGVGWFCVWQEKGRRNEAEAERNARIEEAKAEREARKEEAELNRQEQREERQLIQKVLDQKSEENAEMRQFIMDMANKPKSSD